ncbi:5,6-dimethylbenzimidazole synthase [Rhodovastum atsumiense]|uniref:5,6-dimethylbenzimidazole synthase n=1 Tax=Rhodovastum atsumiense TaxID=504468 RepID=A0A5M6ISM2_9PROT|nr:5,6-dimethylbenzimidazole synthase [Rhodovastum atsumiense]KAA5611323.1 5,6-dimethylbenzimidazole synthase [Rhodovastum atsumiense]CAH2601800.1 5,6-dimethylbenzimidazole synthase [Rhodovastum atsumiense]
MTTADAALTEAAPLPAPERAGIYRAILTRRDVRSQFRPDPVPDAVLSRVLTAAHHAPSVGFMQPWDFLVLRDPEVRRRVHDLFLKANEEAAAMFPPERQALYRSLKLEGIMQAPVNLCITCDPDRAGPVVIGRTHIREMDSYSAVCAVQNLWLAARAEGLGVGWVSILDQDALRRTLGIPAPVVPIAYLCLGWVEGYHPRPELELVGWRQRLPIEQVVRFDGWQDEGRRQDPLLRQLHDDAQAVAENRFLDERLDP